MIEIVPKEGEPGAGTGVSEQPQMDKLFTSRRAVLASIAGAALHPGGALKGASTGNRSLVCIRLVSDTGFSMLAPGGLAGGSYAVTSALSRQRIALQPGLAEAGRLFESQMVALVEETAGIDPERGFVPEGFTAPAWMLRATGASISDSRHAFGFRSGLLMLAPDEAGVRLDDPRLVAQARRGDYAFPNTLIGRQLRQVAGLLAAGGGPRHFVASLGATMTVGGVADQAVERMRQLGTALAAFESATRTTGMAYDTTIFTEPDLRDAAGRRLRLIMGGRVLGGELYQRDGVEVDGVLAEWAGQANAVAMTPSRARF
jgi:hypothetical protein